MSDQDPEVRNEEYDPFDPEVRKRRQRTGPRMPDYSQPRAAPDPGPAIPRRYAPHKRIRADAIVPPEDNPLRGWRWLGAWLLSRDLWPREAATNPVMVYYSGRRRGRVVEDMTGLLPWVVVLILEAVFMFSLSGSFGDIAKITLLECAAVPFLAAVVGASMTAVHMRRNVANLPLEELLLTRLKPVDIIQGLSIRPIAVQSAGLVYYSIANLALGAFAGAVLGDLGEPSMYVWAFVLVPLRWYLASIAVESGGAYAMRAHMCIESSLVATLRMLLDMIFMPLLLAIGTALLFGFIAFIVALSGGSLLVMAFGFLISLLIILGLGGFMILITRSLGTDAMDWVHHHPGEWWVRTGKEARESGYQERGLFTPWKPIAERRKYLDLRRGGFPGQSHIPRRMDPRR
ncbi:hypothetical protein KQI84_16570 [bacterium]|nr:hypothetical protein [bacterium]